MTSTTNEATGTARWPKTFFDTRQWQQAWSRSTIEKITGCDDAEPAMFAVESSPFWSGYEADTQMEPIWDRPLLTVGTLYSFYGPSYVLNDPGGVELVMDRALALAREWGTAGALVANLPEDSAREWAAIRPPDASVRLDIAYWREVETGSDPVVGDVSKHVRTDWRRRWRRASEQGLRLVEETDPDPDRIGEVIGLANESASRHGWPPVYDRTTANQAMTIPGARLLRADWSGQTVAGFLSFDHDATQYLWAGGTHPTLLREVSPYLFVLYELLATAAQRGRKRIEFGRGNDAFKRKYGFGGTDTWSLWYAPDPEDVTTYRAKLTTLHDRLSDVFGVPARMLDQPAPTPDQGRDPLPAHSA